MAPLGDAARAALDALWAEKHGRFVIRPECRTQLTDYFGGRGDYVMELPLDVDKEAIDEWRSEWRTIARSAGFTDALDSIRLVSWLEARGAPSAAAAAAGGVLKLSLQALDNHGIVVSASAIAELGRVLSAGEAGDTLSQCTCCLAVWILYFGQPPSAEDAEKWELERARVHDIETGRIDVNRFESTVKLMKRTMLVTLERALKSPTLWAEYFTDVLERFDEMRLPKCATMLHRIVQGAKEAANGLVEKELFYLRLYFFRFHLGVGMPVALCSRCAVTVLGSDPDRARSSMRRPTASTAFDMQLSEPGGGQLGGHTQSGAGSMIGMAAPSLPSYGAQLEMMAAQVAQQQQQMAQMLSQQSQPQLQCFQPSLPSSFPSGSSFAQQQTAGGQLPRFQELTMKPTCGFCKVAGCTGGCRDAAQALQLLREKRNAQRKKDEERKKAQEGDASG
jgi:hypothetical protein